ncbi:MAG: hypothetical protein DHS20C17_14310 [Cyclobacteriaceae bacterium]|nr:MAG: hypothetical protein DHS20C17_14310 [Cyclobacteriaceae bacterium]
MILPDLLKKELKIVFCGTAAGDASADRKAYYAGPGNKFYKILYKVGFTDRLLEPEEFETLIEYRIGLTDVAKFVHGNDNSLKPSDFDPNAFNHKIKTYQPEWVCFNG